MAAWLHGRTENKWWFRGTTHPLIFLCPGKLFHPFLYSPLCAQPCTYTWGAIAPPAAYHNWSRRITGWREASLTYQPSKGCDRGPKQGQARSECEWESCREHPHGQRILWLCRRCFLFWGCTESMLQHFLLEDSELRFWSPGQISWHLSVYKR